MSRLSAVAGVVCVLAAGTASPQDSPRFSVVSIRPSADNGPGMNVEPRATGDYSVRKVTLSALLASAYGVSVQRVVGAPSWWNIDRFDIDARYQPTDSGGAIPPLPLLLQSLLRDRFALLAHLEKRNLSVYSLRRARSDGRLGPGLQPSSTVCSGLDRPAPSGRRDTRGSNGAPLCGATENPEAFIANGVTIDVLARALRPATGRDVINDTGLEGTWDITLQFSPLAGVSAEKPTVFAAVQEQLGLKLEPDTAPLDVLTIDRVDHPTSN